MADSLLANSLVVWLSVGVVGGVPAIQTRERLSAQDGRSDSARCGNLPHEELHIMGTVRTVDELDAKLLLALIDHPRATTLALAQAAGASRNTVQSRLSRMDAGQTLRSFEHRVDPAALGYSLTAFITIIATQRQIDRLADDLADIPEVLEVFGLSGQVDLLIRVVAQNADELYRIAGQILALPGVQRTETALTMRRLVEYRVAPLLGRIARPNRTRPGNPAGRGGNPTPRRPRI